MYSQGCGSALCWSYLTTGQTLLFWPIAFSYLLLFLFFFEVQSFLLLPLLICETIPSSFLSPEKCFFFFCKLFFARQDHGSLFHYRLPGLLPFKVFYFIPALFFFFLLISFSGSLFYVACIDIIDAPLPASAVELYVIVFSKASNFRVNSSCISPPVHGFGSVFQGPTQTGHSPTLFSLCSKFLPAHRKPLTICFIPAAFADDTVRIFPINLFCMFPFILIFTKAALILSSALRHLRFLQRHFSFR